MERYKYQLIEAMPDVIRLTTKALMISEYSEKAKMVAEPVFEELRNALPDLRALLTEIIKEQISAYTKPDK